MNTSDNSNGKYTKLLILFFATILNTTPAFAEVLKFNSIKEIEPIVDRDTLVVFDIDNTLIRPTQSLGTTEWYYYKQKLLSNSGLSSEKTHKKVQKMWREINAITNIIPAEKETSIIFNKLQNAKIPLLALTAREIDLYEITKKQLESQNIDFKKTALFSDTKKSFGKNMVYMDGIILADEQSKGKVLVQFFNQFKYKPKKVIFLDDLHENALEVNQELEKANISVKSIQYTALDKVIKGFNGPVAEAQLDIFKKQQKLISDTEAEKLLSKS